MSKKDLIQKQIDEAWLGLSGIDESKLFNPMEMLHASDSEYHLKLTWLITQPQNFSFLCKHILNIDILPSQALILNELWSRRFPMLIASRGFGKAAPLYEPILTDKGWSTHGDIKVGNNVYGRDGRLHKVIALHPQGKKQICKIVLGDGRSFECCEDHLWVVLTNGYKEKVMSTKEIIESGVAYRKENSSSVAYKYKIPNCEVIQYNKSHQELDPYIFGCLLGDGCLTTLTPKIASDDSFIISKFREYFHDFEIKKDATNNNYTIVDINKDYDDITRGSKVHKQRSKNRLTKKLKSMGINVSCQHKFIPNNYKYASEEQRMELVRGLLDTDGSINEKGAIEFTNTNERLVDDLVEVLRSLGIRCKKSVDDRSGQFQKMPQGTIRERTPYFRVFINTSKPVFKLTRKLNRIKTNRTNAEKYVPIISAGYTNETAEMQCITVDNDDHTYITKDYIVTHNSFMLSLYAILRALLLPKRKIIIVGAAFRQSKVLFEYMENIWNNSPILRSMCTQNCGPRREVDRCVLRIHDSRIICLPLGDGCLSKGTLVTYQDRFGYIENISNSIWGNTKFREIDQPHDNGVKDTLTITTKMGFEYSGTMNHKMRVVRDNKVVWVRTDQMKVGDKIMIDRSKRWHTSSIPDVTLDQCYALGAMIGDGHVVINSSGRNLWGVDFAGSIDKKIPDKAMKADREQMTEILKGLFDTDGFVTHSGSKGPSVYLGLTHTSKVLVQQIQYILLHYGIVSKVYSRKRNAKWNTYYELLITGKDAYKFKTMIGSRLRCVDDALQDITPTEPTVDEDIYKIYYDTVADISNSKHHTYDMHVPEGNEYCANGFFSHNSKIRGQRANDILADEFACLKEGSLVETKNGLIRIEDFDQAASVSLPTGDNQLEFEYPSKFIKTPITDVYEIKLSNGYVIRCSKNHKVMTNNGWKRPLELTSNDWLEQSPNINQNFGKGIDGLDEKTAWLMGLLISEGSVTDKYQLQITNTNINIIQKLVNDYGWKFSTRPAYQDPRGWKCKQSYVAFISDRELREKLAEWGMDYVTAHNKKIPWAILQSNKAVVEAFLSGMFEGDGSCFLWRDREINNRLGLAYYSVSERLCRDVQVLMNKLGYDGYINNRDSEISDNKQWFVRWNNKTAFNAAKMLRVERFNDSISKCSIPKDSTYICWDKSRDRWKVNYSYCGKTIQKRFKTYGDAENLVKELKNRKQFRKVTAVKKLDKQEHLYDYYLPVTHSFFAEGHRQHNSIPRDIFETVVVGFGAVASNPIENVKRIAAEKMAKELDFDLELDEDNVKIHDKSNQMILSGTAYYDFNHFSAYWKNWHKIINSKGDPKRLKEVFGEEDEPPKDFSWKDYSIIRIPYELLPEGFMDAAQVARSKATIHNGIYQMEYGAVFTSDSQGFFKRSLIESCVASADNQLLDYKNRPIIFDPMLIGDHDKKYIFGIDPASEVDNFSIIILELNDDHKRIVYSWTTTRSQHREKLKKGYCTETAFYDYCARKIRDLMRLFPCIHIAMDKQGGGVAVMEALHDKDKLQQGEIPIWPIIDPDKEADTDDEKGLHILELCNNANADWYLEANHGLRKDFEDKATLFPQYDALSISLSNVQDAAKGRMFDTMEECVLEIQELKDELSMIQMTQTANGRDRWDTPEVIVGAGKKEKMRKDRYSALMMANMAARTLMRMPTQADYDFYGGFATLQQDLKIDPNEDLYNGPNWFTDGMRDIY